MNLIKNAIVYKAELPAADLLRAHLATSMFIEPTASQGKSAGFVEIEATQELVTKFEGGLAFALRIDEKVLPASAIKAATKKRADEMQDRQGFKPGRKQLRDIKEEVTLELLARALVRTTVVTCFYDARNQFLIVPATSTAVADTLVSSLIHAVGSVKMTTIHVSNLTNSLTTRLLAWLEGGSDDFGAFEPCDAVTLERSNEKISVKRNAIVGAENAIKEAMAAGFTVSQMRFAYNETYSFGLTSDFRFKGIDFEVAPVDPTEVMDAVEMFKHEAAVQLLSLCGVLVHLCDLFGYKPPVDYDVEVQP